MIAAADWLEGIGAEEIAGAVMLLPGVAVLAVWLVLRGGPRTLRQAPPRRNRVPLVAPFGLVLLWAAVAGAAAALLAPLYQRVWGDWRGTLAAHVTDAAITLGLMAGMWWLATRLFARGLRGFGLRWRTAGKDLGYAALNLMAVYPLILLAIAAVVYWGQLTRGPGFEWQQNPGMEAIHENVALPVRIVLLVFTIGIVPAFEETLFRGYFQSTVRGYVGGPWKAILITSVLFAMLHPSMHWPAIFVLSVGMGYAYERSGSLVRSIFMHVLFNGLNVAMSFVE